MGTHVPDRSREKIIVPRIGLSWEPDIEDVIDGLSSTFVEQQSRGGNAKDLRGSEHSQQPVFDRAPRKRLDGNDYKPPEGTFQRH